MRYPTRATVCVSSQAGCAMGCTFCATGQAGFERHLDAGEIVEQVVRAAHASAQPVTNVVFMGMGEPLANYAATWAAVERLHEDLGLSARHITISTVGIVPGIRRLATETLPVTLAISLHAPDDDAPQHHDPGQPSVPARRRDRRRRGARRRTGPAGHLRVRVHRGRERRPRPGRALVRLLRPLGPRGSHVNLIPLNDTAGFAGHAADPGTNAGIRHALRAGGLTATVRRNRGTDIDAACGQLRSRTTQGVALGATARIARRVGKNGPVNDFRWINQSQPQTLYGRHDPLLHRRRLRSCSSASRLLGSAHRGRTRRRWLRHREREEVGLRGRGRRRRRSRSRCCS